MVKYRQALRAASVLAFEPFDFLALNQMVDACAGSWIVQSWYRRLLQGVPRQQLEQLRELTQRPLDVDALRALPEGTLGRCYADFCDANGIQSMGHTSAWPPLQETFARDWVTHRFFKIHDILHCVTGFAANTVASELGLQMFDIINLREPYGIGALLSSPYMVLFYGQPVETVKQVIRGYRIGRKTGNLFFTPFEEMWEMPLEGVRARLGFSSSDFATAEA